MMPEPAYRLTHLGGETCVTGSCHLVQTRGLNLLVDCGAVQGNDRAIPIEAWPVAPSAIHYVLLTHAHIDHIGNLPQLIQAGFDGEILATHPTRALLRPMLKDAMSFSPMVEKEAERLGETIDRLSWGFAPGRDIQRYAAQPGGTVMLDGERCRLRARVHVLDGYSAHADQRELIEWVRATCPRSRGGSSWCTARRRRERNWKSVWVRGEG